MSKPSRACRRAAVALTTVATLAASVLAATPAEAANRVTPGNFTGYGFDQCTTPTQAVMDTWLTTSPYWAVGVYIAGDSRFCGDDKQVNLTSDWVRTQLRNGWRLIPITVGPQASCAGSRYDGHVRISANPDGSYAKARAQGRTEARTTVRAAKRLGIVPRSTLWYDIEAFDTSRLRCRESALSFLSAWTNKLHGLGYVSGVYSSAASGIKMIDDARRDTPRKYAMPDRLWVAEWMDARDYKAPPTAVPPSLDSTYYDSDGWSGHVMRQYRGGHEETYGGVTINIDSNYIDLGRGSLAPRAPRHCGVNVNYPRYRRLSRGDDGAQVKALQCLLRGEHLFKRKLRFQYNRPTYRAVRAFQRTRDLPVTGTMNARSWTVLLSEGPTPLMKVGSASHAVRRLQRSLNAATGARLTVTGVYDWETARAVRAYQKKRHLRRTGVVAENTWAQIVRGRR